MNPNCTVLTVSNDMYLLVFLSMATPVSTASTLKQHYLVRLSSQEAHPLIIVSKGIIHPPTANLSMTCITLRLFNIMCKSYAFWVKQYLFFYYSFKKCYFWWLRYNSNAWHTVKDAFIDCWMMFAESDYEWGWIIKVDELHDPFFFLLMHTNECYCFYGCHLNHFSKKWAFSSIHGLSSVNI